MKFDGLVPVYTMHAKIAAKNALRHVSNLRKKKYEEAIQKEMNKKFFPAKTREKAIKRLRKNERSLGRPPCVPEYTIAGWGREMVAEEILSAIKVTKGETIYLSLNYADFVREFLKDRQVEDECK